MLLPVKHNPDNGFTVVRVHYEADPLKASPEWSNEEMKGYSPRAWMREFEIDYSHYDGKPFFPEFQEYNIAKRAFEYKHNEVLYRGWDFGFHRPCCVITKLNEFDQWCWMKMILGEEEGIMAFGKRVRQFCLSTYPGAKYIDACDPAGDSVSDKSEKTSIGILNTLGIWPQFRKQPIKQGAEIIRQKLMMRVDGKPGILISPDQEYFIDMMKGGLHYPEATREGQIEKEFYLKDGYYDHGGDALRYIAVEMFTIIGQQQEANEIARDPMKDKYAMGNPSTSADMWGTSENEYQDPMEELF